jgi:hypothetical protein
MPADPPPATPGDDDLAAMKAEYGRALPWIAAPWDAWFPRLFALADEALASRAELARLDAALAAAAHLGRCWAALCRCTDEFLPDYPDACAEHEQALYGAVEAVIAATGAGREEG